jgi:VanZ family protein
MLRTARLLQFFLLLGLATYLSLSGRPPEVLMHTSDKVLHAVGYALLLVSAQIAFPSKMGLRLKAALLMGHSLMIEAIQHHLPYRFFSTMDLVANLAGLILAGMLITGLRKWIGSVS